MTVYLVPAQKQFFLGISWLDKLKRQMASLVGGELTVQLLPGCFERN